MKIQRQSWAFFLLMLLALPIQAVGQEHRIDVEQALLDLKTLASDAYQGRETGTEGGRMAQEYIQQRMEEMGLKPYQGEWFQSFSAKGNDEQLLEANNVVGVIQGTASNEAIVISAHYDHLGVRGDEIYHGADDNASGTAAILALASYFQQHPPKHSIIFAAFDAEEKGIQGSRYFVKQLREDHQIRFNLNFDMVGRNEANEIFASGTYHTPELRTRLAHLANQELYGVLLRFGHDKPRSHRQDWTYASDHGSFFRIGIPFLYFGVEDHPDYHKPSDEFEKISPQFYHSVLELLLETALILDEELEEILMEE